MYEKIGCILCIKYLHTSSRSVGKEGYFTSSNMRMEMAVSLKISDLKKCSKITFKESYVFVELYCFEALPKQMQTLCRQVLIFNANTF